MEFAYRLIDSLLLSAVALALGAYAFRLDPRSGLNRLLLLICLCFVVRNTTALLAFAVLKERGQSVALFKANFLFHALIFSMNLHFFLLLRGKKEPPAWALALVYLPMLAPSLLVYPLFAYILSLCYLSKVKDRFADLVGILVIARELPGRKEFQSLCRITGREL